MWLWSHKGLDQMGQGYCGYPLIGPPDLPLLPGSLLLIYLASVLVGFILASSSGACSEQPAGTLRLQTFDPLQSIGFSKYKLFFPYPNLKGEKLIMQWDYGSFKEFSLFHLALCDRWLLLRTTIPHLPPQKKIPQMHTISTVNYMSNFLRFKYYRKLSTRSYLFHFKKGRKIPGQLNSGEYKL